MSEPRRHHGIRTKRVGESYRRHEPAFRAHFREMDVDATYDDYAEAYRCGACLREDEPRSSWLEVRDTAIEEWKRLGESRPWVHVETLVKFAFNRSKERVRDGSQGVNGS